MNRTRWVGLSAAASVAVVTQLFVIAAAAETTGNCKVISPTVTMIEIFSSADASVPEQKIESSKLGSVVCKLDDRKDRFKIRLGDRDVWVQRFQFKLSFNSITPWDPPGPWNAAPAGTSASAKPFDGYFSAPAAVVMGYPQAPAEPRPAPGFDSHPTER
jgi:hypothetical protein